MTDKPASTDWVAHLMDRAALLLTQLEKAAPKTEDPWARATGVKTPPPSTPPRETDTEKIVRTTVFLKQRLESLGITDSGTGSLAYMLAESLVQENWIR